MLSAVPLTESVPPPAMAARVTGLPSWVNPPTVRLLLTVKVTPVGMEVTCHWLLTMLVYRRVLIVMFASTMLSMVSASETTAVPLKMTLSIAVGAPGNCQFKPSDQLVFRFGTSAPVQRTDERVPMGPEV